VSSPTFRAGSPPRWSRIRLGHLSGPLQGLLGSLVGDLLVGAPKSLVQLRQVFLRDMSLNVPLLVDLASLGYDVLALIRCNAACSALENLLAVLNPSEIDRARFLRDGFHQQALSCHDQHRAGLGS
jgi:hypothetical protein